MSESNTWNENLESDPKFYCFFNCDTNTITKISPSMVRPAEEANIRVFEIESSIAADILSGKVRKKDIVFSQIGDTWRATTRKHVVDLFTLSDRMTRIESMPLTEISPNKAPENSPKDALAIYMVIDESAKTIVVTCQKDLTEFLQENIILYITAKNDPSYLMHVIEIRSRDFREGSARISIPESVNISLALSDISIYTKRIFNAYYLEQK